MSKSNLNPAMSMPEWLEMYNNQLPDRSFLKGTGLEDARAFEKVGGNEGDSGQALAFANAETQTNINKLADFRVSEIQGDSANTYHKITRPEGKSQVVKVPRAKESTFEKFMFSGAPIALLAGPIGGALGLTGAAAAAAGGAITGGALGAYQGDGKLKNIVRGAVSGGVGGATAMIPGIASLGAVGQGAVAGGVRSLVNGGNSRDALMAALTGAASGGLGRGGLNVNPLVRQLAISQLRAQLMPPRRG